MFRYGIITQLDTASIADVGCKFHATPEAKDKVVNMLGFELLDFDGCSEMWVK